MVMPKEELLTLQGGGLGWLAVTGVVLGVVTFVIGIIDGYVRPLACH